MYVFWYMYFSEYIFYKLHPFSLLCFLRSQEIHWELESILRILDTFIKVY